MEIKLFGKSLFSFKGGKADRLLSLAEGSRKDSKFLPDFFRSQGTIHEISDYVLVSPSEVYSTSTSTAGTTTGAVAVPIKKEEQKKSKIELTPKGIYAAKLLHDNAFKLNVNKEYVEEQLQSFRDKLALIKTAEYDMSNGVQEISSIVVRLENRLKYETQKDFFDQFPYTLTSKIQGLTKAHDYLKLGQIDQFLADLPKEAVKAMKDYNKATDSICGKQAVFYILANKKDFKKTDGRRDPILFAQSPFGHFWQILGAWDEEMMLLEDL